MVFHIHDPLIGELVVRAHGEGEDRDEEEGPLVGDPQLPEGILDPLEGSGHLPRGRIGEEPEKGEMEKRDKTPSPHHRDPTAVAVHGVGGSGHIRRGTPHHEQVVGIVGEARGYRPFLQAEAT